MKIKTLEQLVTEKVVFDGIYCKDNCNFKYWTDCRLFSKETGYNYMKEKAKRLPICIRYFGK